MIRTVPTDLSHRSPNRPMPVWGRVRGHIDHRDLRILRIRCLSGHDATVDLQQLTVDEAAFI